MKKLLYCVIALLLSANAFAVEKVSLTDLNQAGWEKYRGKVVEITTPLVVCGTFYDSLILSTERLFVPEELAVGLQNADSTEYFRLMKENGEKRIKLECKYPYSLNLGATVRGLRAQVVDERHLLTGSQPRFKNYKPKNKIPVLKGADMVICSANIQNYFVHQGGYATRRNTDGQHALQCLKVASALERIGADIYTICELEKGDSAPEELTDMMNKITGKDCYEFVHTDSIDGDTISVGFVYNKLTVRPYGQLLFAYPDSVNAIFRNRFMLQGFEHIATGERIVLSLNHLRSKRGSAEESCQKRMANSEMLLSCISRAYADSIYTDPDMLLVGDFNSYAYEKPLQMIVDAGYADMVQTLCVGDYSYSYKGECGFLDRAYASPSMQNQIVGIVPLHWNTDYYYSAAYYSKYNYKNRIIPKQKPADIRKYMSRAARRNLLFRYSDHDPLLIGVRFDSK